MTSGTKIGIILERPKERGKIYAGMAELADALDSGSSEGNFMQVQFLLPAPKHSNPNLLPIGETFGFSLYFDYPNFNTKIKKPEVKENDKHERNGKLR